MTGGPGQRPPAARAVHIRPMAVTDWPEVAAIYAAGIRTGHATFEPEVPDWAEWDAAHVPGLRYVAVSGPDADRVADPDADRMAGPDADRVAGRVAGRVLGWAALAPVSTRRVYAGVGEHSLYVAEDARGHGVGREVLAALLAGSEAAGFWTVQTNVFPENTASIALHLALGFRQVGVRERVGRMPTGPLAGRWRDVVLLERRSAVVGRDG